MMKLTIDKNINNDKNRGKLHDMMVVALMNKKCRRKIGKNEILNYNKLSMTVDMTFGNSI